MFHVDAPPCVIVDGDIIYEAVEPVVAKYAGTVRHSLWPEPRWQGWDALVVVGKLPSYIPRASHLRVVQLGGQPIGTFAGKGGPRSNDYSISRNRTPGHELVIPHGLGDARTEFVKQHLIPILPEKPHDRSAIPKPVLATDEEWCPILENADGRAIAVVYRPHNYAQEVWYLPEEGTAVLDAVIALAFEEWSAQAPERFPSSPKWTTREQWMSAHHHQRICAAHEKTHQLENQIAQLTTEIETQETELEKIHDEAARSFHQRLLTEYDDALVDAVAQTLEVLGFAVVNLDKQLAPGEPKMGDLLVSEGEWKAVVEVKGYTKGAKANDLLTVNRHRRMYERKHDSVQGVWYVVNSWRLTSPDSRQKMLNGFDDHIEEFGQDDGLTVDTRDLFKLLKQVESDDLDAAEARKTLVAQTGRLVVDE